MRRGKSWLLVLVSFLVIGAAFADQSQIPSYRSARDSHFYDDLYEDGGFTTLHAPGS
ncbi:MAG: hypothetical protein GWN84_09585 [Gammaproteobacteria bacterium]|nr:hypothetical protein [Gammaproteobacteria bacterium]NIR83123.1 hypothetical protein [Gammaproteobacteria bacterium]NIR90785.1 hypothetical protein [Gammaproteobacteria bacterium]NIU04276.1 hypothetical protein [Gammaproteobacteria bacterium]NIV51568.1 hypothetical protein [Gammaproteobacteria bacterium]